MKNGKSQKKNEILQWILAGVILFFYFMIVLINYGKTMTFQAQSSIQSELAAHGDKLALTFGKNIAAVNQASQTLAGILAGERDVLSNENVNKLVSTINSSSTEYGYISDEKGHAVDVNGETLNVWDNAEYAQALTGVQTISDIDMSTGIGKIYFYSPIMNKGVVKGVVCLQYSADQFAKLPRTSEQDVQTVYALMKMDGTLVSPMGSDKPEIGSNVYDIVKPSLRHPGENIEKKLKQNLENGKSGQLFCNINGDERFLNYRAVGTNGWYVVEIYSLYYFDRIQQRLYEPTQKVMVQLLVALFLFFGIVVLVGFFNRAVNNKKNEELQSKAETDLLTGLLNKVATEKHIQDYLEGSGKSSSGMLFVLDIDNFKKINDTMGHAFGDQVLSTLGVRLRNQFRVTDIIGRIGGDEFIVYLKNISDEDARKKEAQRVLEFFKGFQAGDYVKYSATASIGVALYPQDGASFEELYKAADKGVYLAKQRGKNQLAFYEETK